MCVRFFDGNEIVNPAQFGALGFASSLCVLSYERSESFALRHDAAGFFGDEEPGDCRRHS